jgi:hypothetical protein
MKARLAERRGNHAPYGVASAANDARSASRAMRRRGKVNGDASDETMPGRSVNAAFSPAARRIASVDAFQRPAA